MTLKKGVAPRHRELKPGELDGYRNLCDRDRTSHIVWGNDTVGAIIQAQDDRIAAAQHTAIERGSALLELQTAALGVRALYPLHWDRTDGAATIMPENVERFEMAFNALGAALDRLKGGI